MKLIGNLIFAILLCIPPIAGAVCIQGDCINGHGASVLPDGSRYAGEFRDGVRSGRGSITYPDGREYVGEWLHDKPYGKGTLLSIGRFKYNGEFADGVRQGQGTLETVDGKMYEGQWLNDAPHGQGRFIDRGREEFVGSFENGRRKGLGEATYTDGTSYKGKWADDMPNGQGVKTMADGRLYSGEFKNGLMSGSGMMILPDGSQVKIQWQKDSPPGKEETWQGTQISGKEKQENWYMFGSRKEVQSLDSQEPDGAAGHTEANELPAGPEVTPPKEPEVALQAAAVVSPQASVNEDSANAEQAQNIDADTRIRMAEADKAAPEAVMPGKEEEKPGPRKGYALYYEGKSGTQYARISKGANIRKGPALTSDVLHTVPSGFPVAVLEQKEDWFLVRDFRARKGWVFGSLLTEPATVIVKVYKGNLRSRPGLTEKVIMQLEHGTVVPVEETRGDWLRVSVSGNVTGWLHRKVIWP